MGATIQNCPEPKDPCTKLGDEINDLINRVKEKVEGGTKGLKQRFFEQINGANGPPGSGVGDPSVWGRHDTAIREQQTGLRNRLNDFNKNNCGDRVPIPADAWSWATRPAPKAAEWTRPATAQSAAIPAASPGFMEKMSQLTGLTGAALLIYLIVSEGSRLFPPRNLVPVP